MREILDLYIKLGKQVHRDYLNGQEVDEKYERISKEIVQAETTLYLEENEEPPSEEDKVCPSCQAPYEDDYNFCTSCGENIKEFYEKWQPCDLCHVLIDHESMFCPACGALNREDDIFDS